MESTTVEKRGSVVTSLTRSPSTQIWRSSRRPSRYSAPLLTAIRARAERGDGVAHHLLGVVVDELGFGLVGQRCAHRDPLHDLDRVVAAQAPEFLHRVARKRLRILLNEL